MFCEDCIEQARTISLNNEERYFFYWNVKKLDADHCISWVCPDVTAN